MNNSQAVISAHQAVADSEREQDFSPKPDPRVFSGMVIHTFHSQRSGAEESVLQQPGMQKSPGFFYTLLTSRFSITCAVTHNPGEMLGQKGSKSQCTQSFSLLPESDGRLAFLREVHARGPPHL